MKMLGGIGYFEREGAGQGRRYCRVIKQSWQLKRLAFGWLICYAGEG